MTQRQLYPLMAALLAASVTAAPRSPQQAREIAIKAFSQYVNNEISLKDLSRRAAPRGAESQAEQFTPYYFFSDAQQRGFVLVSGSTLMPEVLGYGSQDLSIQSDDQLPESMRGWLQYVADVEAYLEEHPERASLLESAQATTTVVNPLLTTLWGQDTPYNDQCPVMNNGMNAVTGCMATSVSQIINYHEYPSQFQGSYSYIDENTTRSIDYSNFSIDYSLLRDNYSRNQGSTAERAEVAHLMMGIGYAINMSYGSTSGTITEMTVRGLNKNLGHTKAQALRRIHYTLDEWNEIMQQELLSNNPIIFDGQSSTGGHSFIVDGVDSNGFYHVNWGWDGLANNYFDVSIMHPEVTGTGASDLADGFNQSQDIIVNLGNPDKVNRVYSQLVVPDRYYIKCNKTSANLGETITLSANTFNSEPSAFTGYSGIVILKDGQEYLRKENDTKFTVKATIIKSQTGGRYVYSSYGSRDISNSITLPADMLDGTYRIYMYVRPEDANQYAYIRQIQTHDNYWTCIVSDQKASLSHPMATLPVEPTHWNFETEQLSTCPSQVRVTLRNTSESSLACALYARFTRPDGKELSDIAADRVLSICPSQEEEVAFDITFDLNGEWTVKLYGKPFGIDTEDLTLLCSEKFNVETDPTRGANFTITRNLEVTNDKVWNVGPIDFSIQLTNVGAAYDGKMAVRLFSISTSTAAKYLRAEIENEISIPSLQTQEVTISGELNLPNLNVASTTLYARIYYLYGDQMVPLSNLMTNVQIFKKEEAAIEAVTVDPQELSAGKCYDIYGRSMQPANRLPGGIYIVNGRKLIIK